MSILMNTVEKLPTWFTETVAGRAVVEAQHKKEHAERQTLVDARQSAIRDQAVLTKRYDGDVLPPLVNAERAAAQKLETARARLQEAHRTRASEAAPLEDARRKAERALVAGADPRIDAARRAMDAKWARMRDHDLGRGDEVPTGYVNENLKPITKRITNEPAIRRILAAQNAARVAFEALKLANPDDLDASIQAIDAGIPWAEIGQLE
jgi:hypothetical protein